MRECSWYHLLVCGVVVGVGKRCPPRPLLLPAGKGVDPPLYQQQCSRKWVFQLSKQHSRADHINEGTGEPVPEHEHDISVSAPLLHGGMV